MRVSGALRSRAVKHVMWWNTSALNPRAEYIYPLSHFTFTHNTGVYETQWRTENGVRDTCGTPGVWAESKKTQG